MHSWSFDIENYMSELSEYLTLELTFDPDYDLASS